MPQTSSSASAFQDSVVLVTGAAAGIGLAVARMFAARGARLFLIDRDEKIVAVAAELGAGHRAICLDVREDTCGDRAVTAALDAFGRLDILVNNVGIGPLAPAEDYPLDLWDATLSINLRAAFLFAKAAAHPMIAQGYGRIVNLSSQAAVIGIEGHVAYCTSKAGILGMTRCMALEWGKHGITVNALSPTVTETELGLMSWGGEKGAATRAAIPTGRFAKPEEVAEAVLYLASPQAAMVNGANLAIDGGYTIR
ncbi:MULTISPECIES: GolD/DthD family dehydrogenase [Brucella]|uniref:D-threitol dehydrogenase n=1 Tax=Brucella lupini TaxID=255457 RepID=A0A256GI66_9HYPH|nr:MULTISPECIES: D-threitol dehydrogenase [Brucella]KAB2702879.1 D-threitol dehydrogenase [Brucella lupini]KAB2728018.1 D-threitol dehydrogenase [Brucella anthropi]KAB2745190.1 D-threitol dehydrogenase [Brucella anthropi]KAB2800024.1 D-threitol dehydrogenase [Brucella anthropi]KAB2805615.1 D-threitol dehydrogenase [Brucella anthropi]